MTRASITWLLAVCSVAAAAQRTGHCGMACGYLSAETSVPSLGMFSERKLQFCNRVIHAWAQ